MKLILLILISIMTCSCDKNDDLVAPPITEENTFSCKIDGKLFVAQDYNKFLVSGKGITVELISSNRSNWKIILSNGDIDLHLFLYNLENTGSIQIFEYDENKDFSLLQDASGIVKLEINKKNNSKRYFSQNKTGSVNVTKFVKNEVLILEFNESILYNKNDSTKTIPLTEGKLNINLATLNKD